MIWTYRVFRDQTSRYSVREVFYERDGTIIGYGKAPVALVGDSPEEVLQLITWFREAFDLPILSMDAIDAQIATQPILPNHEQRPHLSFHEVRAALSTEADAVKK
jgi:hypothetical protein